MPLALGYKTIGSQGNAGSLWALASRAGLVQPWTREIHPRDGAAVRPVPRAMFFVFCGSQTRRFWDGSEVDDVLGKVREQVGRVQREREDAGRL